VKVLLLISSAVYLLSWVLAIGWVAIVILGFSGVIEGRVPAWPIIVGALGLFFGRNSMVLVGRRMKSAR
jgi:hypothetical protein